LTQNSGSQISKEEFEALIKDYDVKIPIVGQVANVVYLGTSCSDFVFEGGFKDYVRIEEKPGESKYLVNTNVGDSLDLLITEIDETNYEIKGSIAALYESKARHSLTNLDYETPVMAKVKELTPAGYAVDIFYESVTIPGFMPNTLAGINKLHDPNSIVGQTLNVMIESFSENEGTYIVSRRKYLRTLIPQAIDELKSNTVYEGHVTGTTPFGVFVEFNDCLTGMIHKANINPEWSDRLSDIKPGMGINFYVKEIVKDKIILTQILRESLWDNIKIGQVIDGKVKDNKAFGTLISLDDETMGLIHNSELEKIGRKFQADQDLKVKVLAVDRSNRKIFLTVA
jgi:ribosomal protein S1